MSLDPTPAHADSISFLLSQLGAAAATRFSAEIASLGLAPRAYGVLSLLTGGVRPTQQQLADSLGIHRNNMVGVIDELEAAGWVQRHRDGSDRRAFRIHLTNSGAKIARKGAQAAARIDASICSAMSAEEVRALRSSLLRLADGQELPRGRHPSLGR